ncbi:hypothetical protein ACIBK9_00905 [Nonomuraea sp. NPDC050227]|uniref:hypothetical protein n=1 Tax=Nonomuraea sp. NPDC050227 TaxID=3364360 RepID=UPI003797B103
MLDEGKWRELCERNAPGFTERVHVPGLITRPEALTDLLLNAVAAATTRVDEDDADLPTMRAFRGAALDYDASERLMSGAFSRAHDIHSWLFEQGGKTDICLAANGMESWDAEFGELLYSHFVAPLAEAGVPLTRGIDWYCFVASAGPTPFGVHTDPEPSFIFNLGPASKTAWTWSRSSLSALGNGRPRTLDAEPLLPAAESVRLAPGDFLLIPAGMFHIFRNDGPSTLLGLTVYPEDPAQTATEALLHQMRRRHEPDPLDAFRAALAGDGVERAAERLARLLRSSGYGTPPRFPRRAVDLGPPYKVTRLPIITTGRSVFAMGRELTVDLGDLAGLLQPGALVGEDELGDAAATPELRAAVRALIQVGVLRSVGTPQ